MGSRRDQLIDRVSARLRAFELVQQMQAGDASAAAALAQLSASAEAEGYSEVVRIGLFGQAVSSWVTQDEALPLDVDALIKVSQGDGDRCMVALGLALRAAFVADAQVGADQGGTASPAFDADLAESVVILEDAPGEALEMISAHTACGIAFDFRSLWELGDEQYVAALRLGAEAEEGIGDTLLAAVLFNRAEAQVSWASKLRQLDDLEGLAERWEVWEEVSARSSTYAMPAAWHTELLALGHLMGAISGHDVTAEAGKALHDLRAESRGASRAIGHLTLALALSRITAGGSDAVAATDTALRSVDPDAFPALYDLALYLAAEVEVGKGRSYGLQCAQRQIKLRWADRLAHLGAMRSRIASQRRGLELDRLTREAKRDDLTGIGNRRALAAYTSDLDRRGVDRIAVIMVDVDRFKSVNDDHGHGAGDAVLARIAQVLDLGVRPEDVAVRLGGDEFMVAMAGTDIEVARERATSLLRQVNDQVWSDLSPGLHITVSMGVAEGRRGDLDAVRARADKAVYEAKRAGGGSVAWSELP